MAFYPRTVSVTINEKYKYILNRIRCRGIRIKYASKTKHEDKRIPTVMVE